MICGFTPEAGFTTKPLVTTSIIADYETAVGTPRPVDLQAIRKALERASVEFIDRDRPGVRLGRRK